MDAILYPEIGLEISRLLPDLRRYARSLVRNDEDAADLVQDCIERALKKATQFRADSNLKAWLFTLMRSLFINGRRHEAVARRYASGLAAMATAAIGPAQLHRIYLAQTIKAVTQLPPAERGAVTACGLLEATPTTVAAALGLSTATLKARLCRGRAALRARLGEVG